MKCGICGCLLNETPDTLDCGGDCLRCMAEVVQDPDSIKSINQLRNKGHHDMTMTHKHTPAPWVVGDSGEGYNRYSITTLKPIAGQRGVMTIALCAGETNARLIAAAPELLAALKRMEQYFGNVFPTRNEEALVLAARAAISKATGE